MEEEYLSVPNSSPSTDVKKKYIAETQVKFFIENFISVEKSLISYRGVMEQVNLLNCTPMRTQVYC